MNRSRLLKQGWGFMLAGLVCLAIAFGLVIYNAYTEWEAEQNIQDTLQILYADKQPSAETANNWKYAPGMEMPVQQVNGITYIGVLEFPKRGIQLPVIQECTAIGLKYAPCRYNGSVYQDNLILAGHNYKKQFGILKYLQQGDTVIFRDNDSNQFCYEVYEIEILPGTAVKEMMSGEWDLTLFTCTKDGQNRVTVRCMKTG